MKANAEKLPINWEAWEEVRAKIRAGRFRNPANPTPDWFYEGSNMWHLHKRLWERYDLAIQFQEYQKILTQTKNGAAPLIRKEFGINKGREEERHIYAVDFERSAFGPLMTVVSITDHRLVTFLPAGKYHHDAARGWLNADTGLPVKDRTKKPRPPEPR